MHLAKPKLRRIRYAGVALVVALLVSFPNLLGPLDLVLWTMQSKLGSQEVSGTVAFVEVPDDFSTDSSRVAELSDALDQSRRSGARSAFLDLAPTAERSIQLAAYQAAFASPPEKSFIVSRPVTTQAGPKLLKPPFDRNSFEPTVAVEEVDVFDAVWRTPTSMDLDLGFGRSFAATLIQSSSIPVRSNEVVEIDYRHRAEDVPTIDFFDLAAGNVPAADIRDKQLVFGFGPSNAQYSVFIPGSGTWSRSYVSILAAETAFSGGVLRFGFDLADYAPFLALVALLLAVGILAPGDHRKTAYTAIVSLTFIAIVGPVFLSFRVGVAGGLVLLSAYAVQCLQFKWRAEISLRSDDTGLPTIAALERDMKQNRDLREHVLITAKLHNFADVMAAAPPGTKIDYFDELTKRLRVGEPELVIYTDGAARLFWLHKPGTPIELRAHLEALHAIFNNPIRVGGKPMDVAITYATDATYDAAPQRRVSLAAATSEKTSLSAQPIIIGEETEDVDEDLRVSLQSRIDAALETGEIFPVYQPQVRIQNEQVVGFEALVRWNDAERGFISPSYFIQQCEQAGRMQKLQTYMLTASIAKFQKSALSSITTLSVNVSSTLLRDTWLVEHVAQILEETRLPPSQLVLEITETARIHDYLTASSILESLRSLGVGLSLDDFGTGMAGLEYFLRFPFTELKIDRMFTSDVTSNAKARAIVQNVLNLGHELGVKVVCEGVEDRETLDVLSSLGCRFAQGYLFGRPFMEINATNHKGIQKLKIVK